MKAWLPLLLIGALLMGCSRKFPGSDEVAKLEKDMLALREANPAPPDGDFIEIEQYPDAIKALSPKKVYARPEGIYVKLTARFVEEGGLFIPYELTKPFGISTDPGYIKGSKFVYYYQFKG